MTKQYLVNIDRRGRMTMPREVREHFGILGGGEIVFVIEGDKVMIEFPQRIEEANKRLELMANE